MLSYETFEKAEADRNMLRSLLVALGASQRSLRRDECGAWRVTAQGARLHVGTERRLVVFTGSCLFIIHCLSPSQRQTKRSF